MMPEQISIEWAGYTADGTHLDVANYSGANARRLVEALQLGAWSIRRAVLPDHRPGMPTSDLAESADMLERLAQALRAEG